MKYNLFHILCYYVIVFEVNCKFLSLLDELDMKNPVIIGKKSDLKTRELFDLSKAVMKLNQTISLSSNLRNISFQTSPGIIIQPNKHTLDEFYGQTGYANIQKTWIVVVVDKNLSKYSRIDEPLYLLRNGTLFEHYEFKSIRKMSPLGNITNNIFKWNENIQKNFYDRRGNFENITLITVTEAYSMYNQLPKNLENIANVSKIVPNTYEVRITLEKYFKGLKICRFKDLRI